MLHSNYVVYHKEVKALTQKLFYPRKNLSISRNHLIGLDEQKRELKAFCQFVWSENWQEKSKVLHFMSTILLYGPPGTGKTSLLMDVANSFSSNQVKYYRESLDLLIDKELGETSKLIKNLFETIIEQSKCGQKVFLQLDDIDSVLSSRFISNESSGIRRAVNTFLIQLDELLQSNLVSPPIIAATTNMFSHLDSAIKRRFSLKMEIAPLLSQKELEELLQPIIDVIGGELEINFEEIETIVKQKDLTPHDIILIAQRIFLSHLVGNKVNSEQFIKELSRSESSKVSFDQQKRAFSPI